MIRFGLRCGGIRIPGRLRAAAIEASKLLEDLSIVASPGQATGLPQESPGSFSELLPIENGTPAWIFATLASL